VRHRAVRALYANAASEEGLPAEASRFTSGSDPSIICCAGVSSDATMHSVIP